MYGPGGGGKSQNQNRGNRDNKRNSKQKFKNNQAQSQKSSELRGGIQGFLATSEGNTEKRCIKELFNILNDSVEHLYPQIHLQIPDILQKYDALEKEENEKKALLKRQKIEDEKKQKIEDEKKQKQEENGNTENKQEEKKQEIKEEQKQNEINESQKEQKVKEGESTIEQEIAELRKNSSRIWFNYPTNSPGVIFVKMHEAFKDFINVQLISEYLINNLDKCNSRFVYRFMPVSLLCKASGNIEEFKRMALPIIQKFVNERKQDVLDQNESLNQQNKVANFSWCVEFKSRNNQKIKRPEYIQALNDCIQTSKDNIVTYITPQEEMTLNDIDLNYFIDYKYGDYDFIIEVYRDLMMFSIVKEYKQRKRYNISQLLIKDNPIDISSLLNKGKEKEKKIENDEQEEGLEPKEQQIIEGNQNTGFDNENEIQKDESSSDGEEAQVNLL